MDLFSLRLGKVTSLTYAATMALVDLVSSSLQYVSRCYMDCHAVIVAFQPLPLVVLQA